MLYQQDLLRLDDERCARARTYAFECAQGSIRTVLSSASYCKSHFNALVVHEQAALTVCSPFCSIQRPVSDTVGIAPESI